MFQIEYTNRFKKDLELMQKRNVPMFELKTVIEILESGEKIPEKYKNHKLKGDYLMLKKLLLSGDDLQQKQFLQTVY